MRILLRSSALLKFTVLTWLFGLSVGFAAGLHVAAAPDSPVAATTSAPFPATAGMAVGRGGEFVWSRTPT
jgi:hypothetical protein